MLNDNVKDSQKYDRTNIYIYVHIALEDKGILLAI